MGSSGDGRSIPVRATVRPDRPADGTLGVLVEGQGGPAAALAMRRIGMVIVEPRPGATTCSVVGIGNRLPVVRRVSLHTAAVLARAGVPTLVRREPSPPRPGRDSVLSAPTTAPATSAATGR